MAPWPRFAEGLKEWSFDVTRSLGVEGNVARFRNGFRDLYDSAFPWKEGKRRKRDREKPWLDDDGFKELVGEKGVLYSRKIRVGLDDTEQARLAQVTREVNRMRQSLRRAYFDRQLEGIAGDLRATWGVLGEVLRGHKGRGMGSTCGYFEKDGAGVTDGAQIAGRFCDFYCKVGPKLAARLGKERDGAFLEYMGIGQQGGEVSLLETHGIPIGRGVVRGPEAREWGELKLGVPWGSLKRWLGDCGALVFGRTTIQGGACL